MSPSASIFLTNRSDYNSLVLFRHFGQILAAAQTDAIEQFCIAAASKPGTELHYFGLLWNCAFKAGIASAGAHLESTALDPPDVAATAPKISPPSLFTRDLSALQSSSPKPFGSLHHRFHRRAQTAKRSASVPTVMLQADNVSPPPESSQPCPIPVLSPQPPHSARVPSSQPPYSACVLSSQIPQICEILTRSSTPTFTPVFHSVSDTLPSTIDTSSTRTSRTFGQRLSWPSRRPKLLRWLRAPITLQPKGLQASLLRP
ncbi:hypothetical protein GALMADRAFT_136372 [Galerina marginata CBS 339.88]|uniref:Uncharacterized protein n=1 Tax=Galerina marginata (strain CBS 339.88) TaxID=685588 RepID=A0A067TBN1_GALM3|nr:hypothetical protein GALMADRAFT_136372 [Galerina marginata CBS 339.88]